MKFQVISLENDSSFEFLLKYLPLAQNGWTYDLIYIEKEDNRYHVLVTKYNLQTENHDGKVLFTDQKLFNSQPRIGDCTNGLNIFLKNARNTLDFVFKRNQNKKNFHQKLRKKSYQKLPSQPKLGSNINLETVTPHFMTHRIFKYLLRWLITECTDRGYLTFIHDQAISLPRLNDTLFVDCLPLGLYCRGLILNCIPTFATFATSASKLFIKISMNYEWLRKVKIATIITTAITVTTISITWKLGCLKAKMVWNCTQAGVITKYIRYLFVRKNIEIEEMNGSNKNNKDENKYLLYLLCFFYVKSVTRIEIIWKSSWLDYRQARGGQGWPSCYQRRRRRRGRRRRRERWGLVKNRQLQQKKRRNLNEDLFIIISNIFYFILFKKSCSKCHSHQLSGGNEYKHMLVVSKGKMSKIKIGKNPILKLVGGLESGMGKENKVEKGIKFLNCIKTNFVIKIMLFFGPFTRLVLVCYLEPGLLALDPMKQQSRDTSLGWLCGQNFILTLTLTLTKNSIVSLIPEGENKGKNNGKLLSLRNISLLRKFRSKYVLKCLIAYLKLYRNAIHLALYKKWSLMYDIEKNPGPDISKKLDICTLNCRGLGKIDKFRLTLNKASQLIRANPNTIIMLQETMVKDDNYLKLAWKGTYAITYGTGNSQGCITLAGNALQFNNQINFGSRGHAIEVVGLTEGRLLLLNIYAPNGYANDKKAFFIESMDIIKDSVCKNVIVAGDFNLTFSESDRHKRNTCTGEQNIAKYVTDRLDELGLRDAWIGYKCMTWKRCNVMSRLDRIYTRLRRFRQVSIGTNWSFSDSDHAMVRATFESCEKRPSGPRICKLNPRVVLDPDKLTQLRTYLVEQLNSLNPNCDPHMKLEFVKMSIRTKAIELGKFIENEERINLRCIDNDIKLHEKLLTEVTSTEDEAEIVLHLERQINEKNRILDNQGKYLAWKAKTKWYNDGEKSNKYFLNLLKRNSEGAELDTLVHEQQVIMDPVEIEETVNKYYKDLYNSNSTEVRFDEDFLSEMFTLPPEETSLMSKPLTLAELWAALKPLKDTAPGPDGISHIYLKKLWDIIGPLILQAWHFSIEKGAMPPSHEKSFLRLIPKAGKDNRLLKNWRPITLSNCDHKLITRVYNSRLINLVGKHISGTQTAYVRGRNITDNIRTINAAIQLANFEPGINGSVIALDAQKAFDTVNHKYLSAVLVKIGLHCFVPIFDLLYKNLVNNMIINGQIVGQHDVRNGVKQGDALSCTLFILAIEPLIKNIEKNVKIKPIESAVLQYKWPKCFGYADDITCVMQNDKDGQQALFTEYEKFSKISGLVLNADKTEVLNFGMERGNRNLLRSKMHIIYLGKVFEIAPTVEIKINGIVLCQNLAKQKKINCDLLLEKMDKHFLSWSKRHLSLLGKIQIYKTFGISQFLYHLGIFEPTQEMWKAINSRINRYIWNKHYNNNQAPMRIKKEVMLTPVSKGGFGMIDLWEVAAALRLRRHLFLVENSVHPLSKLICKLITDSGYLSNKTELSIDEILNQNLELLYKKKIADCQAPEWQLESDLVLHRNLLQASVMDSTRPRKRNSKELSYLRRNEMRTLADVVQHQGRALKALLQIAHKQLIPVITIIARTYKDAPLPGADATFKIKNEQGRWVEGANLSSKTLREILFSRAMATPKIVILEDDEKVKYFSNIKRLINVQNKSRMLRLIYGDVYCAERTARFGLSESDQCRRCFGKETIMHLLMECPYTLAVYSKLGINDNDMASVLGAQLSKAKFEIRCDFLNYLVFRQHTMPPEVLVRSTLEKFSKGIAKTGNSKNVALNMLSRLS